MKKIIFLLCFIVSFTSFSQISIGPTHIGKPKKFKNGEFEKFKKTTTLFVLPNTIQKNEYQEILEKSWTVTPYEIVDHNEFNIENYINGKYSIADLKTILHLSRSGGYSLHVFFDIRIFDDEEISEKSKKVSSKKWEKNKIEIILKNSSNIARFYINPRSKFYEEVLDIGINEIPGSKFNDEYFFNYKSGYLKNYFQKVNDLLEAEKLYWMYADDYLPALNSLSNKILYVPSYMDEDYNILAGKNGDSEEEIFKDLFKEYQFKYEIIENHALNKMILEGKDIYYLRFVKVNTPRFLQIINAQSGEIIYRNYIHGNSHKIKSKHIDRLNETITNTSSE
ncbi:hypothetical protein ACNI3T_13840 [Christiangramia sp. ASW11-125]|uniref:hypothetical protein n=1 Tax=Christiangramia sp. ASW11-125 TaxID=3400701 RepID=UPI003AAC13FD